MNCSVNVHTFAVVEMIRMSLKVIKPHLCLYNARWSRQKNSLILSDAFIHLCGNPVIVTLLRELLQVRLERMPVAQVNMLTSSEPSWVTSICSRPSNPSCTETPNRGNGMAEGININLYSSPNYLPHYLHLMLKSLFSVCQ